MQENPQLQLQLENSPHNAKYTFNDIQNNLLKAGSDIIVDKITEDIHEAEAFSTIVDTRCVPVHCYAHRLNLVVVNTAHGVEQADDFFGFMEATYRFFSVSLLCYDKYVQTQRKATLKVMEIPRLSDARCVCRHVAVQLFQCQFRCLTDALKTVAEKSSDCSEAA